MIRAELDASRPNGWLDWAMIPDGDRVVPDPDSVPTQQFRQGELAAKQKYGIATRNNLQPRQRQIICFLHPANPGVQTKSISSSLLSPTQLEILVS
jgi:hypothetical protein